MDDDLTPEKLQRIVESATNPVVSYRRQICRRLARQTYNQFGIDGLLDLLSGIDDAGRFASVVVIDRDEVDNFLFDNYAIFDPDMFEKVQMTEEWDAFIADTMSEAGRVIGEIVQSIIEDPEGLDI